MEKTKNRRSKMAAPPPHHSELGELARCLRQERLYVSRLSTLYITYNSSESFCHVFLTLFQVSYEKKQLQQLNEQLATAGRRLAQSAWTTFQQRENLEVSLSLMVLPCLILIFPVQGLVMSRGDSSPQQCCQRANLLQQAHFTDAYKLLSHQMVSYSEFLAALRSI